MPSRVETVSVNRCRMLVEARKRFVGEVKFGSLFTLYATDELERVGRRPVR